MAKNNQEFQFDDILHLDSILPKHSNQSYDNQMNRMSQMEMSQRNGSSQKQSKVVNRYHLHAILVHRGTLNAGHYYAFIRPNVDEDRWFEFNDSRVTEVSK